VQDARLRAGGRWAFAGIVSVAALRYRWDMAELSTTRDFARHDRADWERAAAAALGDRSLDDLTHVTADGVAVSPLYTRADVATEADEPGWPGLYPHQRGRTATGATEHGWDIRQRHDEADAELANRRILADLEGGATSVELDAVALGLSDAATLQGVIDGVMLELAPVALRPHSGPAADLLVEHMLGCERPSEVRAELGLDPLGIGGDPAPAITSALRCHRELALVRSLAVDGTRLDDAGVSTADQLAGVLACGVEYLRLLADAGLGLQAACDQLVLHVTAGTDQFETMAALRGLRRCWARVTEVAGDREAAGRARVHATTSRAVMSRYDPWVNLLRTTTACFAAGAGGADGITVLPFDEAVGGPDDLALRLARNTQLILTAESGLHQVIDPGGGSPYVEALTEALAERAWARFQEIERAGGFAEAHGSGLLAQWADAAWSRTETDVAHRRLPLTGVSEYPSLTEPRLQRPRPGHTRPVRRRAQAFETLRDAADAATCASGARPTVFLATLGPQATHGPRASFAANLFAAGGLAVTTAAAFADTASLSESFARQPRAIACLCSSDRVYAEWGSAAAAALRDAGATEVWLAGTAELAGVDHHIHTGGDAVDDLRRAHRLLGVPA